MFVKTYEELDKKVDELATRLAAYSPEAMQELKSVLNEGSENWESLIKERAVLSARLSQSEYALNAMSEFKKS